MSTRREKINAAMDSAVRYSPLAGNIQLLSQVLLVLLIHIRDDGLPAGGRRGGTWSASDRSDHVFKSLHHILDMTHVVQV